MYKRGTDLNDQGMQKEQHNLLIAAVGAARESAQSLTEIQSTILWDVLDFTRTIYGHPGQIRALAIGASHTVTARGMCVLKSATV